MQSTSVKLLFAVLGVSVLLPGCVAPAPNLDQKFGDAVHAAQAQQTLNPDASLNREPAVGTDGHASKNSIDRYYKTFEKPPAPTNIMNIGVGSSTGSSTGSAK